MLRKHICDMVQNTCEHVNTFHPLWEMLQTAPTWTVTYCHSSRILTVHNGWIHFPISEQCRWMLWSLWKRLLSIYNAQPLGPAKSMVMAIVPLAMGIDVMVKHYKTSEYVDAKVTLCVGMRCMRMSIGYNKLCINICLTLTQVQHAQSPI